MEKKGIRTHRKAASAAFLVLISVSSSDKKVFYVIIIKSINCAERGCVQDLDAIPEPGDSGLTPPEPPPNLNQCQGLFSDKNLARYSFHLVSVRKSPGFCFEFSAPSNHTLCVESFIKLHPREAEVLFEPLNLPGRIIIHAKMLIRDWPSVFPI